jgi:glycerol-3-phosphate dehydrogenase (NAD(P)+)
MLGAGNLGTTLALMLWEKGHSVAMWTVEEDVAEAIREGRENPRYLPGHYVHPEIGVSTDIGECMENAEVVVLAVPSHAVREAARECASYLSDGAVIVDFAKGIEVETGLRMSQVLESEMPPGVRTGIVAVSGPSIASELVRKLPTAVEVSSKRLDDAERARGVLETPFFRLYVNDDLAGVELGGVFKNVFAIGAGICDGLKMGVNTKASYITRSIRELSLLGHALGARGDTFMGLSGLGDLIVTCASEHSRNRRFGEKVGQGFSIDEAQRKIGQVVEGVRATKAAYQINNECHLKLSIVKQIYQVIYHGLDPRKAVYGFIM